MRLLILALGTFAIGTESFVIAGVVGCVSEMAALALVVVLGRNARRRYP